MVIKLYLAVTAETLNHCNCMLTFQQIAIFSHRTSVTCQICREDLFQFVSSLCEIEFYVCLHPSWFELKMTQRTLSRFH